MAKIVGLSALVSLVAVGLIALYIDSVLAIKIVLGLYTIEHLVVLVRAATSMKNKSIAQNLKECRLNSTFR